jgi:O-antigen/teichoic acid export membrane protein
MRRNPLQMIALALVFAACVFLVLKVAVNWGSWVVLGVIVVTAIGAAIAIYPRRYPSQKRSYTRSSDEKYRR